MTFCSFSIKFINKKVQLIELTGLSSRVLQPCEHGLRSPQTKLDGSLLIQHHHLTGPGLICPRGVMGEVCWRPSTFQLSCMAPAQLLDQFQHQEGGKVLHAPVHS